MYLCCDGPVFAVVAAAWLKKVGTCARCRQKHADRRERDLHGDTRPVLASMPRELYSLIKADADERAETAEQRIIAKAAFD